MKEKIIIRREYNPFSKQWGYLIGFPEEKANRGRILCQHISYIKDSWIFECCSEADLNYFRNRKLVHKDTEDAEAIRKALEQQYNEEFEVVEKIMKGMEVYG